MIRPSHWLLVLAACAPIRRRADGEIVRHVGFDGNGGWFSGHDDYQLAAQMVQEETAWGARVWPFVYTVDPRTLDRDTLRADAFRLEVWYAHHGWFDARVDAWEVRELRRATPRRAAMVDVWGLVDPGPRSVIRGIEVYGADAALVGRGLLRPGDPFDLDLVYATRDRAVDLLVDQGYPYAAVEVRSEAHPADQAVDVVFEVDTGISGTLGPVTVAGAQKVREHDVLQVLQLTEGDPYSLDALRDAQRRLFQVGAFSVATVEPDLSDPTRPDVPVSVRVVESRFRTLRLGGGFEWDSFIPVVQAQARLQHVNLLRELVRADVAVRAGLAFDLSQGFGLGSRIPIWGVDLGATYPRLFGPRTDLELSGTVEQNVYAGLWEYRRPLVDLSVVHRLSDRAVLRLGPHFEDYTFIGGLGGQDLSVAQQRLFGISGDSLRYQLTALDQGLTIDWRDDPARATQGAYLQIALREAVPLSTAGFGFVRGTVDARKYFPIGGRDAPFTLAAGLGATVVAPYGETTSIPLPERAFLGGPTGLRGFRPRQVGPYTTLCTYPSVGAAAGDVARYDIPQGGNFAARAGAEGRYGATSELTLAGAVEIGLLSENVGAVRASDLRLSAGPGLRYDTPVGPLRFDLSFRPLYPEDDGPLWYGASCLEADRVPRVYDFFSQFGAYSGDNADRHPGFAMVFYLTFGEAL